MMRTMFGLPLAMLLAFVDVHNGVALELRVTICFNRVLFYADMPEWRAALLCCLSLHKIEYSNLDSFY